MAPDCSNITNNKENGGPWPAERMIGSGRLEDVWEREIRDVGRLRPTCSVSSGVGCSCQTLGFQIENVPGQQQQPNGALFRASLGDPGQFSQRSRDPPKLRACWQGRPG